MCAYKNGVRTKRVPSNSLSLHRVGKGNLCVEGGLGGGGPWEKSLKLACILVKEMLLLSC